MAALKRMLRGETGRHEKTPNDFFLNGRILKMSRPFSWRRMRALWRKDVISPSAKAGTGTTFIEPWER